MLKLECDEFGYVTTTLDGTFFDIVDQAFSLIIALFERMGNDGKAGATILIAALANYFNIDREAIEETRKHVVPQDIIL